MFAVEVFAPEKVLNDWQDVLTHWVQGLPLSDLSGDRVALAQFIESDLIYRLVWGMEAARVFETAQGNPDADALTGTAVTAIETGTFSRAASILIRSGFDHRLAAISAVTGTGAAFDSAAGMRQWIRNLDPALAFSPDWPTPESRSAWEAFAYREQTQRSRQWIRRTEKVDDVTWYDAVRQLQQALRGVLHPVPHRGDQDAPGPDRDGPVPGRGGQGVHRHRHPAGRRAQAVSTRQGPRWAGPLAAERDGFGGGGGRRCG